MQFGSERLMLVDRAKIPDLASHILRDCLRLALTSKSWVNEDNAGRKHGNVQDVKDYP